MLKDHASREGEGTPKKLIRFFLLCIFSPEVCWKSRLFKIRKDVFAFLLSLYVFLCHDLPQRSAFYTNESQLCQQKMQTLRLRFPHIFRWKTIQMENSNEMFRPKKCEGGKCYYKCVCACRNIRILYIHRESGNDS